MRIVNFENLGCESLIILQKNFEGLITDCLYNHNNYYCAIKNVRVVTKRIIKSWNENCDEHDQSKSK